MGKKLGRPVTELRGVLNCLISHIFKVSSPRKYKKYSFTEDNIGRKLISLQCREFIFEWLSPKAWKEKRYQINVWPLLFTLKRHKLHKMSKMKAHFDFRIPSLIWQHKGLIVLLRIWRFERKGRQDDKNERIYMSPKCQIKSLFWQSSQAICLAYSQSKHVRM